VGGLFCTTNIGTEPYLIYIGDHTVVASDVMFVNHDMAVTVAARFLGQEDAITLGEIRIGNHCFIGARTILLPGISLGDGVIVGAGSIVKSDLPEPGVYVGIGPRKVAELDSFLESAIAGNEVGHRFLADRYPGKFFMRGRRIFKRGE